MAAQSPESHVDVLLNEPVGTIAPEIYGHFVEHLGGVVYDGIWVGENSPIPNVNGLRKQLVDALKRIKPGMIRWPGGCFADQYDWRDGTGPRDKRPKRTNFWVDSPGVAERRQARWAAELRSEPVRHRGLRAILQAAWARSPTSPPTCAAFRRRSSGAGWSTATRPADTTTLAAQRAADGEPEPFGVRYWGVGNESWGCGGNFDPEDYGYRVQSLHRLGALLWSATQADRLRSQRWQRRLDPAASSANSPRPTPWDACGAVPCTTTPGMPAAAAPATGSPASATPSSFDAEQYYDILREADEMESLITAHWTVMGGDRSAPSHQTGGGRVGRLVRHRHRAIPGSADRPAEHHARRGAGRAHAGHLQPSRRQGRHGQPWRSW